jgi:hypothetical protein
MKLHILAVLALSTASYAQEYDVIELPPPQPQARVYAPGTHPGPPPGYYYQPLPAQPQQQQQQQQQGADSNSSAGANVTIINPGPPQDAEPYYAYRSDAPMPEPVESVPLYSQDTPIETIQQFMDQGQQPYVFCCGGEQYSSVFVISRNNRFPVEETLLEKYGLMSGQIVSQDTYQLLESESNIPYDFDLASRSGVSPDTSEIFSSMGE